MITRPTLVLFPGLLCSDRLWSSQIDALSDIADIIIADVNRDGANDLGMLASTNFGVAFKGKPFLRKKIPLQINHTDLSGLLFLQGYKLGQFVEATVK